MICLENFVFPDERAETDFVENIQMNGRMCYNTFYPFKILSANGLKIIDFEPITILYGGNGSGKSTALNIIAEKLKLKRGSAFNKSNFYTDYLKMCKVPILTNIPENSGIITSDDVFDYMLDIRNLNEKIDIKREEVFADYIEKKFSPEYQNFQLKSLDGLEQFKQVYKAKRKTQSQYTRSELQNNVREYSNGESAYRYFTEKIGENGFYILDEPENSLSPKRQIDLAKFIEESARFFGCQFIISTHSPFLLAIRGAKIYDLDAYPVSVKRWTELENVRIYYEFFKLNDNKFQQK